MAWNFFLLEANFDFIFDFRRHLNALATVVGSFAMLKERRKLFEEKLKSWKTRMWEWKGSFRTSSLRYCLNRKIKRLVVILQINSKRTNRISILLNYMYGVICTCSLRRNQQDWGHFWRRYKIRMLILSPVWVRRRAWSLISFQLLVRHGGSSPFGK